MAQLSIDKEFCWDACMYVYICTCVHSESDIWRSGYVCMCDSRLCVCTMKPEHLDIQMCICKIRLCIYVCVCEDPEHLEIWQCVHECAYVNNET